MFLILILVLLIGLITGAYSHKWLQSVTGAPDKVTQANAVDSLKTAGSNAFHAAVDAAHAEAKSLLP